MTESQFAEIRDYLLTKKLPIDIVMEVNDHFVSQIQELMREENLSFEDSFTRTKELWADEFSLEIPFYILANRKDAGITKFESRIKRDAQWKNFRYSSFVTSLLLLLFFLVLKNLEQSYHQSIVGIVLGLCLAFSYIPILYNLIFNSIAYKTEYQKVKLSVYHDRIMLVLSVPYFMVMYLKPFEELIAIFNTHQLTEHDIAKIFVFIALLFMLIYSGIWQIRFAQRMRKIKNFIKFT